MSLRSFANGGNPIRRSVLSTAAPWPEGEPQPELNATQRGLASILPAQKPAPTSNRDPLDELHKLVRVLVPKAKIRLTVIQEEDGITPAVRLYKVECYGPEVGAAVVCSQGHSPATAVGGLSTKWARARRDHAVAGLVAECERLAGEAFTPEAKAKLEAEMRECRYSDFDNQAARWRKAAQRHAA
jgi:hypothetical protein